MTTPVIAVVGRGVVGDRVARRMHTVEPDVRMIDVDPRIGVAGFDGVGVAVLATPSPHAELAAGLVERGIAVVSVADEFDDVGALLDLDDHARNAGVPLVVGAGMAPGLTGLLARHLARQLPVVDEIHVALHGTAGPSCAHRHHDALRGRAISLHDDDWVYRPAGSGRELCWFPEPVGAYDCYAAELADPLLLHRSFSEVCRITARMSATRRDRLTSRLPMLSPPNAEGGVGAIRVEVRGADDHGRRETMITGVAELVGTIAAATATAMASGILAGEFAAGVVTTCQEQHDTLGLLHRIERLGVRLQEFTGVPS